MSAFWNSFGYGSVKPICLSANLLELFVGADMCKYVFYLCVARAGLRCVIRFSPLRVGYYDGSLIHSLLSGNLYFANE